MKIYIVCDREGNVHVVDNEDNLPLAKDHMRYYCHTFSGKRKVFIHISDNDMRVIFKENK